MNRENSLLPLIAAFKIAKALLLFFVALELHHLLHGDIEETVRAWAHAVRIDPESKYAHLVISKMTGVPPARLHELGIGTFLYGLLFLTEGTGLLLRLRWAEYLTVVSTLGFLPLEIYELFRGEHKALKAIILILNILIAVYLILALRHKKTEPAAPQ